MHAAIIILAAVGAVVITFCLSVAVYIGAQMYWSKKK